MGYEKPNVMVRRSQKQIYKNLDSFQYISGQLQFFPTAEGYYDFVRNAYIYNYTDHLGNIRVSYARGASGGAEVLEENNYYPFGLKQEGYNSGSLANQNYNYKYNGKELQETGMYDYGARFYMPDIGRWGVVDPLAEKYRRHSTYNYTVNNPIRFIDPDGRGVEYFGKEAEKTAQGLEKKLDKQIEKLNKSDASDKSDRIAELKQSKQDISDMRNDKTTEYKFNKSDSKEAKSLGLNGPSTLNTGKNEKGDNVVTMFADNNTGSQIHEGRHGGQTVRGELGDNYGVADEVSAYRAQYSFDGKLEYRDEPSSETIMNRLKLGQDPTKVSISNIDQIKGAAVNSMVDPGFKPIYPPRDSAGNLITPLDVWNKK